jgi:hypothetical protein
MTLPVLGTYREAGRAIIKHPKPGTRHVGRRASLPAECRPALERKVDTYIDGGHLCIRWWIRRLSRDVVRAAT